MNARQAAAAAKYLREGAAGKIEMKVDQVKSELTQRCKVCSATKVTKLEVSDAGDDRLFADLDSFQDEHKHAS